MGATVNDETSQTCRVFASCAPQTVNSILGGRPGTLVCPSRFSIPNKLPERQLPTSLGCHQRLACGPANAKSKRLRLASHGSLRCHHRDAVPLSVFLPPPPPVVRPWALSTLSDRTLTGRKRGLAAGMKANRCYMPTQQSASCCHASGSRMIPSILSLRRD